jgi:hypothetical protein
MAAQPEFLKIINGNVVLYNNSAQAILHYYMKGDAVRADWFEREKGSIEVLTKGGKLLIINRGCQIVRII